MGGGWGGGVFFFNDTATTEIYTLSLHDALPICVEAQLPNLLPESYRTDISLFLDTGNVWAVDYSDSIDETNTIRSSVGIGANMYTTIGPLSFIIAQSLSKSSQDKTERFNFRLGTSF